MKEIHANGQWRNPRRAPVPLNDYSDFDPDRPGVVIAVMMGAFSGVLIGAASVILTQYAVLFTVF